MRQLLALTLSTAALFAAGAQAQDTNMPFQSSGVNDNMPFNQGSGGLGDHVASRVLNMNGYNITNLADPFFEGDAVTLGWLTRNFSWDHMATKDVDLGGFALGNIGSINLDGTEVAGGTFEAPALRQPQINGGALTGISVRNAFIEVPRIKGGTLEAPAIVGPTINSAEITSSEITGASISDATLSGALGLEEVTLSGDVVAEELSISGDLTLDGATITGLADADDDSDAMSLGLTRQMIEDSIAALNERIDALEIRPEDGVADAEEIDTSTPDPEGMTEENLSAAAFKRMENMIAGLNEIKGDLSVSGTLSVDGPIEGAVAEYRPTPNRDGALGYLGGSDALSAISGIRAIVYKLPDGDLAAGIDPETVPAQMGFVLRDAKDGTETSVDYDQMIGPMIAVIQQMDSRIKALEAMVGDGK